MTASTKIEIVGLKESLRVLQQYDKKLRREITKDFNYIVNDAVQQMRNDLPQDAPISGWARNWTTPSGYKMLPWKGGLAVTAIKGYTSGKIPREFQGRTRNAAVFGIRWRAPHATLFDMSSKAKTPQGQHMVDGLTARYGRTSRLMWRTFDLYRDDIEHKMELLVKKVTRAANDELRRRGGK